MLATGCGESTPPPRHAEHGEQAEAADEKEEKDEDEPDLDGVVKEAENALAAKDYARARKLAESVLAKDPEGYPYAMVVLSEVLDQLGRKDEARQRLRAFVAAHPKTDPDVYDALGWAELDGGNEAKGEAAFRAALQAAGDKGDEDAYYGLAIVAADHGDAKATAQNLEAAFAINPARRIEASKDDGFASVRSKPPVAALFTKKKLEEAGKAVRHSPP